MRGISVRNYRLLHKLCGEDPMKLVIIVTNMWSSVNEAAGLLREKELMTEEQFFKRSVDDGARLMRHYATLDTAVQLIWTNLSIEREREALRIQNEMVGKRLQIYKTSVAKLKNYFKSLIRKLRGNLEAMELLEVATADERDTLERGIRKNKRKIKELDRRMARTNLNLAEKSMKSGYDSLIRKVLEAAQAPRNNENRYQIDGPSIIIKPKTSGFVGTNDTDDSIPIGTEAHQRQSDIIENAPPTDERDVMQDPRGDFNDHLKHWRHVLTEKEQLLKSSSVQDRKSIEKEVGMLKKRIRMLERSSQGRTTCEEAVAISVFIAQYDSKSSLDLFVTLRSTPPTPTP
jgi:hypothetical protein